MLFTVMRASALRRYMTDPQISYKVISCAKLTDIKAGASCSFETAAADASRHAEQHSGFGRFDRERGRLSQATERIGRQAPRRLMSAASMASAFCGRDIIAVF